MADALCGPSNALQQFKQQSQLDRSLQQDRLTSRHTPLQGFRSLNPNAGVLDPEFEAFQAGVPLPELPQYHQHPSNFSAASQTPSWASDFQRMSISPLPAFQSQQLPHASSANLNWAQGFRDHVSQSAPRAQTSTHTPQAFQHIARYGMNGYQNFQQPSYTPSVQSKGKARAVDQFDEAAFERAFDQAREDMLAVDEMEVENAAYEGGASTANFEVDRENQLGQRADVSATSTTMQGQMHEQMASLEQQSAAFNTFQPLEEPIREDTLSNDMKEEEPIHQTPQDDDALAATAKELLEKVEHNKSDKFKNSQFLHLMRKLRDREMKVEGDQMVETTATANTAIETLSADDAAHDYASATANQYSNGKFAERTLPGYQRPLEAMHVDTRPPDHSIPLQEQDHDVGRINPNDGQAVVDLLNDRHASPDDIGTSNFYLSDGTFYYDFGKKHPLYAT